jgi:hypothetical protein
MTGLHSLAVWSEKPQVITPLLDKENPIHDQLEFTSSNKRVNKKKSLSGPEATGTSSYKNLREMDLSIGIIDPYFDGYTPTNRIFRNLTHLMLDVFDLGFSYYDSLVNLSVLTHIGFEEIVVGLDSTFDQLEGCVKILLSTCPSSLRVAIIPAIDYYYKNTKLRSPIMDPKYNLCVFPDLPFDKWYQYSPKVNQRTLVKPHELHQMWRLALGIVDTRVVVGSTIFLPDDHILQDKVIVKTVFKSNLRGRLLFPENRWVVAEEIIERRRRSP